ncbi:16S rRNA (guanine(527)-N(7))-methyltransferase RsmG [Alkaliflexus imshenetskii]|uniref:16S rRNA (guanine(527)-N(7))-methyltransferase RsmG n=1 Tax=Alkaliflexus imshenetskii TaxID=286730 RepID=UPI00047B7EF4|nr:16S rRNA (guanine(527)-N(7))-methyltransferase RsmG [Alkaliflexus imshenetskii]
MELILKYFPSLTDIQKERFARLKDIYADWNSRINVISRKDMDAFYEHHVLHSLAIGRFIQFTDGTKIIDIGTGGGFPGIPLAILFPNADFTLIDSIGKKIKVVQAVAEDLGLENVDACQSRSEQFKGKFDFIVSRAVTALPTFVSQSRHLIGIKQANAISNGILYLKGGDITAEIQPFQKTLSVIELATYFKEPFFDTKKLVHLSL